MTAVSLEPSNKRDKKAIAPTRTIGRVVELCIDNGHSNGCLHSLPPTRGTSGPSGLPLTTAAPANPSTFRSRRQRCVKDQKNTIILGVPRLNQAPPKPRQIFRKSQSKVLGEPYLSLRTKPRYFLQSMYRGRKKNHPEYIQSKSRLVGG